MNMTTVAALSVVFLAAGCQGKDSKAHETSTTASRPTTSRPATTTTTAAVTTTTVTTAPPVTLPSGDPEFPGYPKIVKAATIDSRVRSWYNGQLVDNQVVALMPGVYTPYNPNVPELTRYLSGPVDGDCAARDKYFPHAGGTCWPGVK